ncbi:MAG: hypothetical protein ACRCVU_00900 [Flavobacterium sp.]
MQFTRTPVEKVISRLVPIHQKETEPSVENNTTQEEEPKIKKWAPPGYIRKVKKQIIKEDTLKDKTQQLDQDNEKTVFEDHSVLEVLKPEDRKRE